MNCFVIMPFAREFNEVYDNIRLAVEGAQLTERVKCIRLDEIAGAGRISERLVRQLTDAVVCIADVTGTNPNVMWEVGYAIALDKPTLLISQDGTLPFDLKDMLTVFYERDDLAGTLRQRLATAFRQTLTEYGIRARRAKARQVAAPKRTEFTVAITGSKQAHREKVRRQLQDLLHPYLLLPTHWLVGSWGITDETAITLLVKHGQRPVIVGNDDLDISPIALKLIEKHNLRFIAARGERLPPIPGGRPRDVLFMSRADIVFLLWSGKSTRMKDLMKWYRGQKKNHVVGFI